MPLCKLHLSLTYQVWFVAKLPRSIRLGKHVLLPKFTKLRLVINSLNRLIHSIM